MLRFLTAGESHGPELTVIVEGMPAGVPLPASAVERDLVRRQGGFGRGARSTRIERDHAEITAGVAGESTTGAPIAMRIVNRDFANQPAEPSPLTAPRPGHADLAGATKYGLADFRLVRERASARETASRVAAGAVARQLLSCFGVRLGSFVVQVGPVRAGEQASEVDRLDGADLESLAKRAEADGDGLRCPDPEASARMRTAVEEARKEGQTLGGIFCVFATGVPPGLGSHVHWDRKLDGRLAQAVCSIHAVKGVSVGPAFDLAGRIGADAQDPMALDGERVVRASNRAGGLEGGVTNGEPVVLLAAMKPLSSVRAEIASVDFATGLAADPPYVRSDVCAVPAAAVVGEAMVAWVLADALVERFGQDRLDAMRAAMEAVRTPRPAMTEPAAKGSSR